MKPKLYLLAFLFFIINIYSLFSQTNNNSKYESVEFTQENIRKRGYSEAQLLTVKNKTAYYWVKADLKRKLSEFPYILAIHNIGENEPILRVKSIKQYKKLKKDNLFEYIDKNEEISFFKENLLPNFPDVKNVRIYHFIQGNHSQLKEKTKSNWTYGIEEPIVRSSFTYLQHLNSWTTDEFFQLGGRNNEFNSLDQLFSRLREKEEIQNKKLVDAKKTYNIMLSNSKRVLTKEQLNTIKSDWKNRFKRKTYYTNKEIDLNKLFQVYLSNVKTNPLYVKNDVLNKSAKITSSKAEGTRATFRINNQPHDSYLDSSNGVITYRAKTQLGKTINATAWKIAQNCESVKRMLNKINTSKFKIKSVTIHRELGVPISWTTELEETICGLKAVYTNCDTPCHTWLRKGSGNYSITLVD